jgi:hypothetical protein
MGGFWKIGSITTALVAGLAVSAANAQPPVARPQPPPPAPTTKAPAKPVTTTAPAPAAPQKPVAAPQAAPPAAAPAARAQTVSAVVETPPPPSCQQTAPILAGAQYLESYDAGMGQFYCLYGSTQSFADVVAYYRTALKDRGELVFDAPATHMFEVGKFKETEVAFPPGVTVKDYTWGGSPGYMNPRPGATPAFFSTVIQIATPPPALAGRRN